jgi:hypothetical protein
MIAREQLLEASRRWVPPRGLEQSRPRAVRFTAAGWALVVVSAALVIGGLVAGIVLSAVAARQQDERLRLRDRGVNAAAVVTRLWTSNGEERRHWVQFRFSAGNRFSEGRRRISRATWSTLKLGSWIPVRYDPENPDVYTVFGREQQGIPQLVPFLVGFGVPVSGVLLTIPLMVQRRLLVEGRPAPGVVTKHKRTKGQHGTQHDVRYEFLLLNGSAHAGKCTNAKLVEGQPISVLYEPDNPKRNTPYPLSLVRSVSA